MLYLAGLFLAIKLLEKSLVFFFHVVKYKKMITWNVILKIAFIFLNSECTLPELNVSVVVFEIYHCVPCAKHITCKQ